jgi:hypothetical protein
MSQSLSSREQRAEKRRLRQEIDKRDKRIQELEAEVSILKDDDKYMTLEDSGCKFYQDVWNTDNCSQAVHFTSPFSFTCPSFESEERSFAWMPGVRGQMAMSKGMYSQSIWMKGTGYTQVGLVSSEEEKDALKTCSNWAKQPRMATSSGEDFACQILVDMVNHTAKLYFHSCSGFSLPNQSGEKMEPHCTWENLPDQVWVAVSMKRCSEREAVLLPCVHWELKEMHG